MNNLLKSMLCISILIGQAACSVEKTDADLEQLRQKILKKENYDSVSPFVDGMAIARTQDRQYVYINQNGKVITPPYNWADTFYDGLAIVCSSNCGMINEKGDEVIPLVYQHIDLFTEGLAAVKKENKMGFIDKKGKEIIPPKYDVVMPFMNGVSLVTQDDRKGLINQEGVELTPIIYNSIENFAPNGLAKVLKHQSKQGFINKEGKEIIPAQYDEIEEFSNGFAKIYRHEKWGIISENGQEIFPPKYDRIYPFSDDGLAVVRENGKYGLINQQGVELVPAKYQQIDPFTPDGLARVRVGKGYFSTSYNFINKEGKEILPDALDKVEEFSNGMAQFRSAKNQLWGFINTAGEEVITPKYSKVFDFFDDVAWVENDHFFGLVDTTGQIVSELPLNHRYSISPFRKGTSLIYKDGQGQIIDKTGKTLFSVDQYDEVFTLSNGLILVQKGNEYGFIDQTGNEITPVQYSDIIISKGENDQDIGVIEVAKGRERGLLNTEGKEITPIKYSVISPFSKDGLAYIQVQTDARKTGLLNTKGKEILPPEYDAGFEFNAFDVAIISKDSKYGLVNKQGEILIPTKYAKAETLDNGLIRFETRRNFNVLDLLVQNEKVYVSPSGKQIN